MVGDLLRGGPQALAEVKALVDAVAGRPPAAVRDDTAARIARIRTGAEAQAGLRAFLEREPAPWIEPPPDGP